MVGACAAAVLVPVAAAGCTAGPGDGGGKAGEKGGERTDAGGVTQKSPSARLIGDGSTAWTGAQPAQPRVRKLAPGEKPPQFVVFSWDGAGEIGDGLFKHFREVGRKYDAAMTYFLSGIYLLPESKRSQYEAPGHAPGASDIGLLSDAHIEETVDQVRGAWLDGSEIGTHFNGHFCGPTGVASWSKEEWKSEIAQAKQFVQRWKTNTGLRDAAPLPFDYDKELTGARTPCLEGADNLRAAARELGWRYDTSGVTEQVWPAKKDGLWDLSMQLVPYPGSDREELTMDYNFKVNPLTTPANAQSQMRDGLLAGFQRAYTGNRAPLIVGNHFETWHEGAYMRAVEETIREVCPREDVRCVSFRQLADWLDAQDPRTLRALRGLEVGQAPAGGWGAVGRRGSGVE
ncbi:hypothetical protein CXR04_26710 [Streptomyces sp. CMB-StM0423]|nr:hypothetical protein [Streptomyces sp. CMB-StM0423]AUH43276.1 hypothetical protein CXR04_26710 [Streptomyces sp. CMB-StM0423]